MTKLYTTDYVVLPRTIRGVEQFENDESGGQNPGRQA